MLILSTKQVKTCQVSRIWEARVEKLPGLLYRGWLFVKGESYLPEQKKTAFQRSREVLDQGQFCIVVDEQTGYSLWYLDEQIQLAEDPTAEAQLIATLDLEQLVTQMHKAKGLIKEHRYRLRVYPKSLIGREAVDWWVEHLQISRQMAVQVGQRLIDEGWMHHVWDDHTFEDEYLFYRFYQDETATLPVITR